MTTPAGWYPDPSTGGQRYWDGTAWTNNTTPAPAQPYTAPAPAKKKTPAWVWVIAGVIGTIVLAFGGCVAFVGSVASNIDSSETTGADKESAGTLGSEVRDGKFAFTVESVEAAENWYGDPKPRGQWVIATVQVSNVANEPQSFFVQNQKLIDSAGREYAADTMAAMRMNEEDTMVLDLGPGFTISVKIPFDVPPTSTPAAVVLHDSAFSGGVKVDV